MISAATDDLSAMITPRRKIVMMAGDKEAGGIGKIIFRFLTEEKLQSGSCLFERFKDADTSLVQETTEQRNNKKQETR